MKRTYYLLALLFFLILVVVFLVIEGSSIFADTKPIGTPTELTATTTGTNSVAVTWQAPGNGKFHYRVYRSDCLPASEYQRQNNSNLTEPKFNQANLKPGKYCYKVSAGRKKPDGRLIEGPRSLTPAQVEIGTITVPAPTVQSGNGPFYVSSDGLDSNDCSQTKPCREISRVITSLKNGGTINATKGTYGGFAIRSQVGTAQNPIIIQATEPGALISPFTYRGTKLNIFIENSSYVTIKGFGVTNTANNLTLHCLKAVGSDHLTISHNSFTMAEQTVILTGNNTHDVLVDNNDVSYSRDSHGIYLSESGDSLTITNNITHDNGKSGIQVNAEKGPGQTGDGLSKDVLIEKNIVYNNKGNGLNLLGVQDAMITNNLLVNNLATGIANAKESAAAGPAKVKVYQNTVAMPVGSRYALQFANVSGAGNMVRNNVFYHEEGKAIEYVAPSLADSVDSDYNAFKTGSTSAYQGKSEPHSINISSLTEIFTNPSQPFATSNDLLANSPLKDKGAATIPVVSTDLKNRPRPSGNIDIGAFEIP